MVIVYIFLFLYYRKHLKKFIRQIIPKRENENADDAITSIEKVSQQYLTGTSVMIVCLWVMYTIGFTLVGLKNAILFAILCGLFELVPYAGNVTGNLLAALMAVTQGGGMPMVIGVIVTYLIVQFIQGNFLQTLIVGIEVNINPLFSILGIIVGELLWGIPGMILAVPLLGIFKIICDHIPSMHPYGFLIGREKKNRTTLIEKIRKIFKK
jgi:predicted PurR-regulated permease PerM